MVRRHVGLTARRILGLLWACALLVAPALSADVVERPTPPAEPPVAVIADTEGAIAEITVHYNHDLDWELTPFYADLFRALGPDVHVRVLCRDGDEMDYFIDTWGDIITATGRTLEVINIGNDLTIWARDRRIARQTRDQLGVRPSFVPISRHAYEDSKVNEIDANVTLADLGMGPPVLNVLLHLEGGNVVSTRYHTFVGANFFEENPVMQWERASLSKQLEVISGRSVVHVSAWDGHVPWCHVDMYLTPIDDQTLLVADMFLADEILNLHYTSEIESESGDHAVFDRSSMVPEQLDEVAERMRRYGFGVGRIPGFADPARDWMITYNNVLMEQRDGRRRVLMPVYRLPDLDEFAASAYQELGFEVVTVDVSRLYEWGGALRCIVNVTRRRPPHLSRHANPLRPGTIDAYELVEEPEPEALETIESTSAWEAPVQPCYTESLLKRPG